MNPYDVLDISPSATLVELKEKYRDLVKQHHPDCGGQVEDFMLIRRAYAVIIELRSQPQPCERCNGSGQVALKGSSFTDVGAVCPKCFGVGK